MWDRGLGSLPPKTSEPRYHAPNIPRICRNHTEPPRAKSSVLLTEHTIYHAKPATPENSHKLPKHPIPCALIGRLAVSHTAQQYGVGKMLLADAIKRVLAISDQIVIYAMIVNAIDQDAIGFYEQFGFSPSAMTSAAYSFRCAR